MITAEEWEHAKTSKKAVNALLKRETKQYLKDGNIITKRNSDGSETLLASIDGETLHRVEDLEE